MLFHFSEEMHDDFLRSGKTLCAECDQYVSFRLVDPVMTAIIASIAIK